MANPTIAGIAQLRNMVPELRPTHVYNEAVDVSRDEQEFTRLLVKSKRRRYDDYEFRIVEEDAALPFVTVTDINVGSDPAVFKVLEADGDMLRANQVVRKSDTTWAIITAVADASGGKRAITIGGNIGLAVGDVLATGAPASEENSLAPSPVTFNPTTRVGYQQILRIAWGESRSVAMVKSFLKETRVASNRRQALRWARQLVEAGLIHNPMRKETSPVRYYTGGLYDQNVLNVFDVEGDGSFTYEMLEDMLTALKRSAKNLIGLTSQKVCSEIRKIVWGKNESAVVEGEYMGVPVTNIRCGDKKVSLLTSGNLDEGLFQYHLHLLDERNIGIVTTQDQQTGKASWFLLDSNAATPGQDGSLNVLTCDFGLEMTRREGQALVRNLKRGIES